MSNVNKAIIFAVAGCVFGVFLAFGSQWSFKKDKTYESLTESLIQTKDGSYIMSTKRHLNLHSNGDYDMYALMNKDVGFSSSGTYDVSGGKVTFRSSIHDKLLPDRKLTLVEKFFSREGGFASEPFTMVKNGDDIILFSSHVAVYYRATH